jgi:hypothetical protein
MKQKNPTGKQYAPSVAAAIGVFGIGAFPQLKMHDPIPLLAERFLSGAGWAELLLLALSAAPDNRAYRQTVPDSLDSVLTFLFSSGIPWNLRIAPVPYDRHTTHPCTCHDDRRSSLPRGFPAFYADSPRRDTACCRTRLVQLVLLFRFPGQSFSR